MATFSAATSAPPITSPLETSWWGSYNSGYNVYSSNPASDDNFFSASPGNDTFWGQAGNDTLAVDKGGTDTIYAGLGNDRVWIFSNGSAFGEAGDDVIRSGTGYYSTNLDGGDGNDVLIGVSGVSVSMSGGQGADKLIYRIDPNTPANAPLLAQSVSLSGGAGDDYLESARGAEMVGGIGADIFQLSRSSLSTRHNIRDFKDGVDKIAFDRPFGSLSIQQSGANTIIRDGAGGSVLAQLDNVQASAITSADFVRMPLSSY